MEIREMMNKIEKKIAYKMNSSHLSNPFTNNQIHGTYKNLNNFIQLSNNSKNFTNTSTEDIYNTSINSSINQGSLKLMNDLKSVIY